MNTQLIGTVATIASVAVLAGTLIAARRETRVRLGFEVARLAISFGSIVVLGAITGVETLPGAVGAAVLVGGAAGFAQGRALVLRVARGAVFARRSALGIGLWGAGLIGMQIAAFGSRVGAYRAGQTLAYFSVAMGAGLFLGRHGQLQRAVALAGAPVAAVAAVAALAIATPDVALADPCDFYNSNPGGDWMQHADGCGRGSSTASSGSSSSSVAFRPDLGQTNFAPSPWTTSSKPARSQPRQRSKPKPRKPLRPTTELLPGSGNPSLLEDAPEPTRYTRSVTPGDTTDREGDIDPDAAAAAAIGTILVALAMGLVTAAEGWSGIDAILRGADPGSVLDSLGLAGEGDNETETVDDKKTEDTSDDDTDTEDPDENDETDQSDVDKADVNRPTVAPTREPEVVEPTPAAPERPKQPARNPQPQTRGGGSPDADPVEESVEESVSPGNEAKFEAESDWVDQNLDGTTPAYDQFLGLLRKVREQGFASDDDLADLARFRTRAQLEKIARASRDEANAELRLARLFGQLESMFGAVKTTALIASSFTGPKGAFVLGALIEGAGELAAGKSIGEATRHAVTGGAGRAIGTMIPGLGSFRGMSAGPALGHLLRSVALEATSSGALGGAEEFVREVGDYLVDGKSIDVDRVIARAKTDAAYGAVVGPLFQEIAHALPADVKRRLAEALDTRAGIDRARVPEPHAQSDGTPGPRREGAHPIEKWARADGVPLHRASDDITLGRSADEVATGKENHSGEGGFSKEAQNRPVEFFNEDGSPIDGAHAVDVKPHPRGIKIEFNKTTGQPTVEFGAKMTHWDKRSARASGRIDRAIEAALAKRRELGRPDLPDPRVSSARAEATVDADDAPVKFFDLDDPSGNGTGADE